jgi:hypothetical protein
MQVGSLGTTGRMTGARELIWHSVELGKAGADAPGETSVDLGGDLAVLRARDQCTVSVVRDPLVVTMAAPTTIPDEMVVHPLMAFVGAVVARWTRRSAFHATAVLIGGRAWVLLGAPGSGKSTLASGLAARGHPVLADDLAVIDDHTVLAGPRSCDLRPEAARRLGRGELLKDEVGRPRWREELPPAPYEAPLGGFIQLGWGDETAMSTAGGRERLTALARHEALGAGPTSQTSFFDLLDVPALKLARPVSWDALDPVLDLVEQASG